MRMKAFAPYSLHHLSTASVNDCDSGQAKLSRSGVPVARLQGVGLGRFMQVVFSTPAAEQDFNDFVSELDDEFFFANVPSIAPGQAVPSDRLQRNQCILEAMVENTIEDIELFGRCRHNTLYRLKGDQPNAYRTLKVQYSDKVKNMLRRDMGEALEIILNETIT